MDKTEFVPIVHIENEHKRIYKLSVELDRAYNLGLTAIITGSGPWTEQLLEKVPDNFCLYPFIHFQLDPDGRARPCCKYKVGDASWQQDVPKLPDVDIGSLWEQQEFQNIRDQFLRNQRPSGCKACWDEEAAGIPSMRLQREAGGKQHPYATFFLHIPRTYPKTLDFKLSNLCNLKCRICTPFLSSQWIKETKDLRIHDMGDDETFVSNSKEKFSANPENKEILKKWAPTISNLEFYGGEPLMQQEHNDILKIIQENGKPENTGLYYNTNATICNEDFFKTWSKFNHVTINFSIDDLAQRFEYQRKNAKWNEVLTNIRLYKEYGKKYRVNLELRLYTTVGILNIFYLKEFLEFMKQYEMKVMLNMVHYPHHFSVVNLPDSIKDIIKAKLQSIEDISILEKWSPTIENVINFMYGNKMDSVVYKRFFEKIAIHDEYRQESFRITFPEMSKLLEENEQT